MKKGNIATIILIVSASLFYCSNSTKSELKPAQINATPAILDFGQVPLHNTITRSINITNQGDKSLLIESIKVEGTTFNLATDTTGLRNQNYLFQIASGKNITLDLTFTPRVEGPLADTLIITSNSQKSAQLNIPLNGVGIVGSIIAGKVTFTNSQFRASYVEQVCTIAFSEYPPENQNDVYFSKPMDLNIEVQDYSIPVPNDTFLAVAVIWKKQGQEWNYSNVLGLYGFEWTNPFDFNFTPIPVTENEPVAANIDINADWNRTALDGLVKGTVTFVGAWPSDTKFLGIFAFNSVPDLNNLISLYLSLKGFDIAVPRFKDKYDFSLPIYSGEIKWLGMFFLSEAASDISDVKVIGFYRSTTDASKPGTFLVPKEDVIENIDLNCDFNSLPQGLNPGGP